MGEESQMSPLRRTRIVCTLGPASDLDDTVRAMIRAGMDAARLNFSHGEHADHARHIERVRRIARAENATVAIIADLQGPKIRVRDFANGSVALTPGSTFTLTTQEIPGDAKRASVDFLSLPQTVRAGNRILLCDGLIELQVVSTDASDVVTRVINGGELRSHQGVNLPGVSLGISALTVKDRADLVFAIEQGVDYIAQSFVRSDADVLELKQLLAAQHADIPVIAKIEKHEAVEQIENILRVSDSVMVARGDLGVEALPEQVPLFQKEIIHQANAAGKPAITATQMLESMIEHPRPTRAEASDVANAILDGTDAVMLSAETAMGRYPVQVVEMMARIANAVEGQVAYQPTFSQSRVSAPSVTDAIGLATCETALKLHARVIITATQSGYTARMIARHRPQIPILAVTADEQTLRRLALVWGVRPALTSQVNSLEAVVAGCLEVAVNLGLAEKGDLVVITGGAPPGVPGTTNMVQVRVVSDRV